jgi:hypothetical protein
MGRLQQSSRAVSQGSRWPAPSNLRCGTAFTYMAATVPCRFAQYKPRAAKMTRAVPSTWARLPMSAIAERTCNQQLDSGNSGQILRNFGLERAV